MASANEEGDVAGDAVAILAETREVDEEPLLEHRRNWIVEIGCFGEPPEVLDEFWRVRRG